MQLRLLIILALLVASCSSAEPDASESVVVVGPEEVGALIDSDGNEIPPPPAVPTGPVSAEAIGIVDTIWSGLGTTIDPATVSALGATGDIRLGWLLSDLLRFFQGRQIGTAAYNAFVELAGVEIPNANQFRHWRVVTDYLIAWDVPAPQGYAEYKEELFTLVEPGWRPFFDDAEADVDWRFVSWGGVLIDDRPLGDVEACPEGCIPALDDPPVTDVSGGAWYPDEAVVFGVVVNGEARAYPKNIMEIHEMVNDTLGGRRIGMPYCTLCGAAQAFFTDTGPAGFDMLVLRTSGLLSRSNKVMYELDTGSMFDTFLGVALTGPLREIGFSLDPISVVTSTWGDWKTRHPATTIVAQDGGRGIEYPADPLGGRDDNGPIFPVGDVDQRLPVQEQIVGVVAPDGVVVAFPVAAARSALDRGSSVAEGGISLVQDGGGFRAVAADGSELPTHQAFWFAWSQFQPETVVWIP